MLPEQLVDFGKSVIAVMLFASNILFWRQSDYFAAVSEEKPLLHTWSLGVEEQFYLFFPLVVLLAWRLGPRHFFWLAAAVAMASLALSDWASGWRPMPNFYLLPTRAWELLAGALCALHLRSAQGPRHGWLALAGLAMILTSILFLNETMPFPGRYAVLPVLGTTLIVLHATPQTWVGRILGWRPAVAVGLLSYSAYLWHQPLFAFARLRTIGAPSAEVMGLLCALTFGLAWLSWRYVEQPFRGKVPLLPSQPALFGTAIAVSASLIMLGAAVVLGQGFPSRMALSPMAESYWQTAAISPYRGLCHAEGWEYLSPDDACVFFDLKPKVAVFGNSHAVELAYGLALELRTRGIGVKQLSFPGCEPAYADPPFSTACAKWTRDALASLLADKAITHVVVSYRITAAITGKSAVKDKKIAAALDTILSQLAQSKTVIYTMQAPELPTDIHKIILLSEAARTARLPGSSLESWETRRSAFDRVMRDRIDPRVSFVETTPLFCDARGCVAGRDGTSYYFDDDHMSVDGARLVARAILPLIEDTLESEK
jgi:peptidoglycan/LPS O-acetylase OafA/YrhL